MPTRSEVAGAEAEPDAVVADPAAVGRVGGGVGGVDGELRGPRGDRGGGGDVVVRRWCRPGGRDDEGRRRDDGGGREGDEQPGSGRVLTADMGISSKAPDPAPPHQLVRLARRCPRGQRHRPAGRPCDDAPVEEALLAAVAIAASPFAVVPAVLLLFAARPRPCSAGFAAGWAAGVGAVTLLAVLLADSGHAARRAAGVGELEPGRARRAPRRLRRAHAGAPRRRRRRGAGLDAVAGGGDARLGHALRAGGLGGEPQGRAARPRRRLLAGRRHHRCRPRAGAGRRCSRPWRR